MRTSTFLLLAVALLSGCDQRGTPPTGSTGGVGTGDGTSGGSAGGGTKDTSGSGGGAGDTTSAGLIVYDSTKLLGPVTLTGGTVRGALFFLAQDRSLHIVASSDGAAGQTTVGRETIWDIQITSPDSTSPSFISRSTVVGHRDTLSYYWDLYDPSTPKYAIHFRLTEISSASEVRVAASSGALLTISVNVHSGVDDNTVGWSPPYLPEDTTARLLKLGTNQAVVGKTSFAVRMPKY